MRAVRTSIYALITFLLVLLDKQGAVDPYLQAARLRFESALADKSIHVTGLEQLTGTEIAAALPSQESVIWWLTNKPRIEARLADNPYVQRARIEDCDPMLVRQWGCFRVIVKERRPAYIAMLDKEPWLLGEDGGFISPVSAAKAARLLRTNRVRPKIIRGLVGDNHSPERVRARFDHVRYAIDLIEETTALEIEWAKLKDGGEIDVRFSEPRILATFDMDDEGDAGLEEKARRLKQLVADLGPTRDIVAKVDMAFKNVAVVSLKR